MNTLAAAFVLALAASLVLTPVLRSLAIRYRLLDHGLNSRTVHNRPMPRMGGLAILVAFFLPLAGLALVNTDIGNLFWAAGGHAAALLAGGVAIALLGLYDDMVGTRARFKLAVQVVVASGMWWAGYRIEQVWTPFGEMIFGVFSLPVTVLWIAGVINAMNLIDGLDGLAGGVAFAATGALFVVALGVDRMLMALFMAALAGAVLGFLRYNFNPASIFMGDSGSLFLGFILATTSLETCTKRGTAVALLVPMVALGLPIADTVLAMTRRAARGAPIFAADRSHIHHRLLGLGITHRQTVLALYGIAVVLATIAVGLATANVAQSIIYLTAIAGLAMMVLTLGGYVTLDARGIIAVRRRNAEMQQAVRLGGQYLAKALDLDEVWSVAEAMAPVVGASSIAMEIHEQGVGTKRRFSLEERAKQDGILLVRFNLGSERESTDFLEVSWADGRTGVDRDTEIALEHLCLHIYGALARIERFSAGVHPELRPGAAARNAPPPRRTGRESLS